MNTLPKKPIIHTLIGIAVFLLVAQPQVLGGSFVLLFLLLWLPYTAVHGIYSRKRPKLWCIKFICWLAAFAAAYAMFAVYNHHARLYAQTVVDDLGRVVIMLAKRFFAEKSADARHKAQQG